MRRSANSLGVDDALSILGLEKGVTLEAEAVKTAYKQENARTHIRDCQMSLRTHPDKNPDNPEATAEFQRVGEAYRVLVEHLDGSSDTSIPRGGPFFNFNPFHHHHHHPYDHGYEMSDDEDDFYEYYDDDYFDDEEEDLTQFYM
ncbi:hypothetical protein CVT25_006536 [Psilocybe cyanescens]|uniref:J domain-containing protein n=1 Tax=Psilocybe cyanescens TaxID=93625 RepID=A0A409XEJ2_PSICY|nr:hypothetical protein CVT25_006536 [Psilocybe cyanescens]